MVLILMIKINRQHFLKVTVMSSDSAINLPYNRHINLFTAIKFHETWCGGGAEGPYQSVTSRNRKLFF